VASSLAVTFSSSFFFLFFSVFACEFLRGIDLCLANQNKPEPQAISPPTLSVESGEGYVSFSAFCAFRLFVVLPLPNSRV